MVFQRRTRTGEADTQRQTLGQDGFSARLNPDAQQQPAAPAQPRYAPAPAQPGYVTVGRRILELADNGDGTATVVRCMDAQADDVDIAYEAGGAQVAAIAPRAFEGCAMLRRVVLPAGLRQIGEMAFSGCARLQRLVIPGSVARVGTLAFAKCAGLAHVRIEPGVQALGPSCFSKCTHLARVDIPSSVAQIGGGAFFGCGRQLTLCGAEGAFAHRYAQLNGIAYDSMSWMNDEDFVYAENEDGSLTLMGARHEAPARMEIPAEVCGRRIAYIAPKAFFASTTLEQLVVGPGVRAIGESAFFGCRALAGVSFERGLERIGDNAFASCESLTQVTLPWGTSQIGGMAFFGCTRLSFVKMPAATRVGDLAFEACAQGLRVFGGVSAGRGMNLHV